MIGIGSQVILRESSPFAGVDENPAAGTIGCVVAVDRSWFFVNWDGREDAINYRYSDLQELTSTAEML